MTQSKPYQYPPVTLGAVAGPLLPYFLLPISYSLGGLHAR